MRLERVKSLCGSAGLSVVGAFHPDPETAPQKCGTLVLLGPKEPGFWRRITSAPEIGAPDPVDRWSERVIGALAGKLGAQAVFPFGGPPHHPFIKWALASGQVWSSPVGLLVHDVAGLFLSFRGALLFQQHLELAPVAGLNPCVACAQKPCLTACPAGALAASGYDVAGCHDWLNNNAGKACLSGGCLVRRSCPASRSYGRLAEQSAHHMRHFHKG